MIPWGAVCFSNLGRADGKVEVHEVVRIVKADRAAFVKHQLIMVCTRRSIEKEKKREEGDERHERQDGGLFCSTYPFERATRQQTFCWIWQCHPSPFAAAASAKIA
jgi:hypothetical protein